jgi:hypothetical protein
MPSGESEPAIPTINRPQTYALVRPVIWISTQLFRLGLSGKLSKGREGSVFNAVRKQQPQTWTYRRPIYILTQWLL